MSVVAAAPPIPIGSRVVLVEDHRATSQLGCKGWRGVVTDVNPDWCEADKWIGLYHIKFDNGEDWNVNASAVALETPTPTAAPDTLTPWERDTALAMALTLADLIEWTPYDGPFKIQSKHARWLRDCVRRDLEGQ